MIGERSILLVFLQHFLIIFSGLFILTLPMDFFILPEVGYFVKPLIMEILEWLSNGQNNAVFSDAPGMLIWTGCLLLISLLIAFISSLFSQQTAFNIIQWFQTGAAYYLALILLMYGFNKIFKYQFPFPEPNILFTPVGQLDQDILFWSTMGTSHSYSVFSGIMEVVPAFLLLFRKTRILGAFIAFFVLLHVFMINVAFGISVKLFSGFLLLLALYLIIPHLKRVLLFFIGNESAGINFDHSNKIKFYFLIKSVIIGLFLIEAMGPAFSVGYFNGDHQPKPPYHGAYTLRENGQGIARVFFHKNNYFITQNEKSVFESYAYQLYFSKPSPLIKLYRKKTEIGTLKIKGTQEGDRLYNFSGTFAGTTINWYGIKVDLEKLPLYPSP